jgi:heme-degrading monooxygenase HmoA
MFARHVRMHLKADGRPGFVQAIDHETIPDLKKFAGFTGEIVLVSSDGREAIGISLWDNKEHAETYNRQGYPEVLKSLEKFVEGKPELRTYEVTNSTIEKLSARKAA